MIVVKIPKIIHFIWLGTHPMHPRMGEWMRRWKTLHPDWNVLVWSDDTGLRSLRAKSLQPVSPRPEGLQFDGLSINICDVARTIADYPGDPVEICFQKLLADTCHLSQRSNIWRYAVVHLYGGVYADTDVEPFKSIDHLVDDREAFAASYLRESDHYGCSFFGATPRHSWTGDLVRLVRFQDPTTSLSMGSVFFTSVTREHAEVSILPGKAVVHEYPSAIESQALREQTLESSSLRLRAHLDPETFAVHHFSSFWFPKGFEPLEAGK